MIVLAAVLAVSCKKETLTLFDEKNSGNSVYFQSPFLSAATGRDFTFGYSAPEVMDTVLNFTVVVSGKPADKEREFSLIAGEGSTMTKGTNYDFLDQKFVIPAQKVAANIKIKLYRTVDIRTERKYLYLKLKANDNFNTNVKQRVTTGKDTLSLLDYYIASDDLILPPYVWSNESYKSIIEGYLGLYSKVKLQLLIKVFEINPVVFSNPQYAKDNYFSVSLLTYWSGFMKLWLAREAAAGRIYKDENDVVITMSK